MVSRPTQEEENDLGGVREAPDRSGAYNAEDLRGTAAPMRPPMSTHEKVEYWLEIAVYDLKSAKVMQKGGQYLHVGFMCQQVVEKALKAAIAKTGALPPKTHDLLKLAKIAGLAGYLNEEQKQLLKDLSPLNVEARYPSYKEAVARSLNKHICKEYIIQTEEMLKWIQEKLQQ